MRRDLTGKRVIVTGASGGIGRAVALGLTAAGARVVGAARSADKLADLAAVSNGLIVPVTADLTVPADRERLVSEAVARLGGLDVLVNNAGVASWGHFATSTEEINRKVLEINFFAPAELTRLAVPHLMRGDRPAVVNVASLCGRIGLPAWPEHSASKHALAGLSEAWRGEFARFGIDVVTIIPGMVKADDLGKHLLRREGKADLNFANATPPADVAAGLIRALRKGRTEVVIGKDARPLLLVEKFFPKLVSHLIARRVRQLYASGQ